MKDLNQSPDPLEPKALCCAECEVIFDIEDRVESGDEVFCSDDCAETWDLKAIQETRDMVSDYYRSVA